MGRDRFFSKRSKGNKASKAQKKRFARMREELLCSSTSTPQSTSETINIVEVICQDWNEIDNDKYVLVCCIIMCSQITKRAVL